MRLLLLLKLIKLNWRLQMTTRPSSAACPSRSRNIVRLIAPLASIVFALLPACGPTASDASASAAHLPPGGGQGAKVTILDSSFTTGTLCTKTDSNFAELRYPEQIPYCNRNITMGEKRSVAKHYGIPDSDFSQYEFDHFIPLAIGGSNDASNLWPQRFDQAKQKDVLEVQLYAKMMAGKVTQKSAVAQIRAWQPGN